jgi:S1-C subfamily serine protease
MFTCLTPVVLASLMFVGNEGDAGYIGVQIKSGESDGIVIQDVVADGPAAKGGLKADDVVVKVNGKEVTDLQDFVKMVRGTKPGDELKLTVKRDGKEKEIKIKVGKKPDDGTA